MSDRMIEMAERVLGKYGPNDTASPEHGISMIRKEQQALAAAYLQSCQRVADMTRALRSAHHALTLLNGCVATDRPDQVPGMDTDKYKNLVWEVDTDNELAEIDAALASSDSK